MKVLEYHSQPTFVLGQVNQPGQFPITRPTPLVDVIGMAEGLTENAGDFAFVRCSNNKNGSSQPSGLPAGTDLEELRVPLASFVDGAGSSINVLIEGGCVVQIPEREPNYYYVVGSVYSPGKFEIENDEPIRLTRALASAGGPLKTAKKKKLRLIRDPDGPNRKEIEVNFAWILDGKQPDFNIYPNDLIFVPGGAFKDVGYGLLGAIPGTVSRGTTR